MKKYIAPHCVIVNVMDETSIMAASVSLGFVDGETLSGDAKIFDIEFDDVNQIEGEN